MTDKELKAFVERGGLRTKTLSEVEEEKLEWLFYPFIPLGKLTLLEGDPGDGKTMLALKIIAALSRGDEIIPKDLYDPERESSISGPVVSIYQTAEDGYGDTIKPRLAAFGADMDRVQFICDDDDTCLTMTDQRIEAAIRQTGAKLLVLDPMQAYLGSDVDMHRANEIRPVMSKLGHVAKETGCAVILIGHMNKKADEKAAYRGLGSIDIYAAVRSVIVLARKKNDEEVRVFCQVKNNLAPKTSAVAFRLSAEKGFEWIGAYDMDADDLLAGGVERDRRDEACEFLTDLLKDGMTPSTEIFEAGENAGITKKMLRSVKKELGIRAVKTKDGWYWKLPDKDK